MPDRLMRRPPFSAQQKVLDLFFLLGLVIGAYQATDAVKSIVAMQADGFTILLLVQMLAMMVAGFLGYRYRLRGFLYKEAICIPLILQGLASCALGTVAQFVLLPAEQPFIADLQGLAIVVATFTSLEAWNRLRTIQTLKKLGIEAAVARENFAQTDLKEINEKAAAAAKRLKA